MNEITIEKVENGYVIRCFNTSKDEHNHDDVFVYNNFYDVIQFITTEFNEKEFLDLITLLDKT